MDTTNNRYATQPLSGSAFVRALKRLRAWIFKPRGLRKFGAGTRVARPYCFTIPSRIEIGERCVIGTNCLFQPIERYLEQSFSPLIEIGDDTYIGPKCQFHCVDSIILGRGCVLSDEVYLSDVGHGLDPRCGLIMDQPISSKGPVRLGNGCFIGFGSTLLAGVQLGDHCVVGTRSVVTKSFEPYTMLAGNPARAIARFNIDTGLWVRLTSDVPATQQLVGADNAT